ncbi:O-fucosyltransferase family protein [uncultured Selenomonas sp.]|uniref:O-fucosyltransferase family protein n=1 Tax=uncultured Selenomonas sp. TaxID=159275 RepID=UPI0028E5680B|nr:O-fucosyltransferase family protein [uncultured Selenomonas sp.]
MNLLFLREKMREKKHELMEKRLKCHPKIHYFLRVWKRRNDEKFVSEVLQLQRNPSTLEIKCFGQRNPEKNIYFIEIYGSDGMGFAAFLRHTLFALFEADRLGFIPVVSYVSSNCIYAEIDPINGTSDPFEYYFEQVSDISIEETQKSARVFLYKWPHSVRIERELGDMNPNMAGGYHVDDRYIEKMALVLKKYIRLNSIVQNKVCQDMQTLMLGKWDEKKVLGVHIRGTDYALNWKNHPNMVTVDEFIEAVDEALAKYNYEYIFLATDDKRRLLAMQEKYGERLIYYHDVARGENELNIAMEKNDRPMHHYLNGLEVVRDMYTLARCDSLICGLSQVAIFARIIRLAEQDQYTCLKVLDNGIYQG